MKNGVFGYFLSCYLFFVVNGFLITFLARYHTSTEIIKKYNIKILAEVVIIVYNTRIGLQPAMLRKVSLVKPFCLSPCRILTIILYWSRLDGFSDTFDFRDWFFHKLKLRAAMSTWYKWTWSAYLRGTRERSIIICDWWREHNLLLCNAVPNITLLETPQKIC